jgi:hypothetical protein
MSQQKHRSIKTNGEGYSDPTAHSAIKNIRKDEDRVSDLIHAIKIMCELAGFHVEERIVLKDKRTGKIWR